MNRINWDSVEEVKEFAKPTPGGYIVKIVGVEDVPEKEYIIIRWDFAQKPLTGYNRGVYEKFGRWPYPLYRSYKTSALGFFKALKTALEESNPGYRFDEMDLPAMRGKYLGVIMGEEEYQGRLALKPVDTKSAQAIQRGDYEVPEPKRESPKAAAGFFQDLTDEEGEEVLPF